MKRLVAIGCLFFALAGEGGRALAQPVGDLIQQLQEGSDFRVRVQAALGLGKTHGRGARVALEGALDDENAAVRAAAAAGLKVMHDPEALPALRHHERDTSPAVRSQVQNSIQSLELAAGEATTGESRGKRGSKRPDVFVRLGKIGSGTASTSGAVLADVARTSREKLRALPGIAVFDEGTEGSRRDVPVVMVTGRVKQLEASREGSSVVYLASIEFVLHKMPGQTIKGVVSGSARASGSPDELADLRRSALEAAIDSAVRRAPEALRAAAR